MNRRKFIAGGAVLTAAGAGVGTLALKTSKVTGPASQVVQAAEIPQVLIPISVGSTELSGHKGHRLLLEGWLRPAPEGPGHMFVFTDAENGPIDQRHVRVYPADAKKMSTGFVQLEGRYFEGKFVDLPTGKSAPAVLTDAI